MVVQLSLRLSFHCAVQPALSLLRSPRHEGVTWADAKTQARDSYHKHLSGLGSGFFPTHTRHFMLNSLFMMGPIEQLSASAEKGISTTPSPLLAHAGSGTCPIPYWAILDP